MNLVLAGLNHKSAPVSVREKISFRSEDFPRAINMLHHSGAIREAAILSTCNRTEIYTVMDSVSANGFLADYLGEFHNIPRDHFVPHLYIKEGLDAARHLFLVAAGLDSLVIGEDQILGQVKQSFKVGQQLKSLGTILHRLFQSAIETGKRIRNETALGENPGSVGEAAVDLAEQIFGDLSRKSVLILGAGEMGKDVAEILVASGASEIMVCSRTLENARSLADQLKGIPFALEALEHPLAKADIVIAAIASPEPLLKKSKLDEIMRTRRQSPLFIVDIGMPRNVEESAGKLENLFLYNMDDLKHIVDESDHAFQREIAKAKLIAEEELEKFHAWQEARQVTPTIQALTRKMEHIKDQEVQKALSKLPNLAEKERAAVEQLAHSLVHKILHEPLVNLKACPAHPFNHDYVEAARQIFGLDDHSGDPS